MGYVIAAILVVLIVGAGIAFFMSNAMNRRGQATIAAPDEGTPLGDTGEHAGEHSDEGKTVSEPESRSRDEDDRSHPRSRRTRCRAASAGRARAAGRT